MNLPNQLTVARLGLTVLFAASLSVPWPFGYTAGLLIFALAGITDYYDGEIARRRKLVSDFGQLMDPLADKVMMAAGFILLVPENAFPAWVAVIIVGREFAITGLRLLAANKGRILPAEQLGKHKMIWQIVTIVYFLLLLALREMERAAWLALGDWWPSAWKVGGGILIAVTLALTLYSGCGYLWKHRAVVTPS